MIAVTLLELLLKLAAIVAGWLLILCLCVLFNEKLWRNR